LEPAMPTDVRKAFGLPESAFEKFRASPHFQGAAPTLSRTDGSAQRFRTSDGAAAALNLTFAAKPCAAKLTKK